jgi:hypothetical protein
MTADHNDFGPPNCTTDLTLLPIRRGEDAQGATSTARAGYRATGGQNRSLGLALSHFGGDCPHRTLERAIGFGLRRLDAVEG